VSTEEQRIEIVKGDSKHDLYAQAYDWGRPYEKRRVFLLTLFDPTVCHCPIHQREIEVAMYILGFGEAQKGDSESDSDSDFMLTGIISVDKKNCNQYGYDLEEDSWLEAFLDFRAFY
jgi:hypothetical protein